ncbi:hypothetical protein, partial [Hymenobacter sp. UV11]
HVPLPIEATWWAVLLALACRLQALFAIGSAKVTYFFDFPSFRRKKYFFFRFKLFKFIRFRLKRAAKIRKHLLILQEV